MSCVSRHTYDENEFVLAPARPADERDRLHTPLASDKYASRVWVRERHTRCVADELISAPHLSILRALRVGTLTRVHS